MTFRIVPAGSTGRAAGARSVLVRFAVSCAYTRADSLDCNVGSESRVVYTTWDAVRAEKATAGKPSFAASQAAPLLRRMD